MPALNGVVNIYSGAQCGDNTGQGLVPGVDCERMHNIKPVLEPANEWGQADIGIERKKRAGEDLEAGEEALVALLQPIFYY